MKFIECTLSVLVAVVLCMCVWSEVAPILQDSRLLVSCYKSNELVFRKVTWSIEIVADDDGPVDSCTITDIK